MIFINLSFLQEIEAAFKLFDKNNDGHISVEELGEAMKQAGQEMSVEEVKDMIKAVDRNGTKIILFLVFKRKEEETCINV